MRAEFQRRTGTFGPEDPWFENRARAFWDDALVTQGAARAVERLDSVPRAEEIAEKGPEPSRLLSSWKVDDRQAHLVDALVRRGAPRPPHRRNSGVDPPEHAEGPMDARVRYPPATASSSPALPPPGGTRIGACDRRVLLEARERGLKRKPP